MAPIEKPNIIQLIDMSIGKTPEHILKDERIKLILSSQAYEDLCRTQKKQFIDTWGELKILTFDASEHIKKKIPFPYLAIAPVQQFEEMTKIQTKEPYRIELAYDPYGPEWRAQMEALPIKTVLDLFQAVAHDKMDMQKQIIVLESTVKECKDSVLDMGAKTIAITRNYSDIMRRLNKELKEIGFSTEASREMADLIHMIDSLGPPPDLKVKPKERPTDTGVDDKFGKRIKDRHIVKSGQGTVFVVDYDENVGEFCIIQANKSDCPESQGNPFELKPYMSPNLEIIGDIDTNPELFKD